MVLEDVINRMVAAETKCRASLFNLPAYKNLVIENLKIKTTKNEEAKHIVVSRPPKRKSLER